MIDILTILLIGIVIYEIFEHLLLPLFWAFRQRGRKPICGPSVMIGKKCIVQQWDGTCGKVRVGCELWNARSRSRFVAGDEAVILEAEGLTLHIAHVS